MQQCMMGAMNEFWLVAPRMHCNMLYDCHHCWYSQANYWLAVCLKKWKKSKFYEIILNTFVNVKNVMLCKITAAIINNINLKLRIRFYMSLVIQVKWLWINDYVKTQPSPSDHLFYLVSFKDILSCIWNCY